MPEPISFCPQCPLSCGPPVTMTAGTSALAAPISCAGVVLSQPLSRTTASIGLARIDSSTSIDIRLRKSMVVGFMNSSPSEIVGKLEWHAAGGPDAALDGFGDPPQVDVAVGQLAPGVTDADDGLAGEARRR